MRTARRSLSVVVLLVLAAKGAAAPVPKGPTRDEVEAARRGYEAVGGHHHADIAFEGDGIRHGFSLSLVRPPEAYATLPDPDFDYTLTINLTPRTRPGCVAQLAKLRNLRAVTIGVVRWEHSDGRVLTTPFDPVPLIAELATAPNLRVLWVDRFAGGEPLIIDTLAEHLLTFPRLRLVCAPFTDQGLHTLARHPTLEHVTVTDSKGVTDAGVAAIAGLKNLSGLSLQGCSVTDDGLKPLVGVKTLRLLAVGNQAFTDRGMAVVADIRSLENLNLTTASEVTAAGVRELGRLPHLRKLMGVMRTKAQLTDDDLAELAKATTLEELELFSPNLTDTGLGALTRLPRLRKLRLGFSDRITDEGMKTISRLQGLQQLSLDRCPRITDAGLGHLSDLGGLHEFAVRECRVTEAGLQAFVTGRSNLTAIQVTNTPVTDRFVAHLARNCPRLTRLSFYTCPGVTDRCVADLARLTELQSLYLVQTKFTDPAMWALKPSLPDLVRSSPYFIDPKAR